MTALNLPPFEPRLRKEQQKTLIYDIIRKKFVVLTPEEYVRQHVVHYITAYLGYPSHLVNVEKLIRFNQMNRRMDVVIFNKQMEAEIIIECKAAEITLDEKVCRQIAVYHFSMPCKYLMITNGLVHFIFEKVEENGNYMWQQMESLPKYI